MPRISVFYDDTFQYNFWAKPEVVDAGQRLVTEQEFEILKMLAEHYNALQAILKEIHERPDLEFEDVLELEKQEKA